jgi:hypothetical protein
VIRNIGQTGENEGIGHFPDWYVRHMFTLAAVDEQAVRVVGLIGGHLPVCLRDNSTHAIPVVNATTYSGMPAHNSTFQWKAENGQTSGFTQPSNTNVLAQGWSFLDWTHICSFSPYPYLLTGEPQFMDLLTEYANGAIYHQYTGGGTAVVNGTTQTIGGVRNASINGNIYSGGAFHGDDLLRAIAWPVRDLSAGVGLLPTTHPENSSYHTYFSDMLQTCFDGYADYRAMLTASANSYVTTNGMWNESDNADGGVGDMWAKGYLIGAVTQSAVLAENSSALTFLNYLVKWPAHINSTFGTFAVGYYQALERGGATSSSPYVTSDTALACFGWGVSWNSGTGLFTLTASPATYALANGDKFMWNGTVEGPIAGGFSGYTPYYVVNKSGSTFQLSASLGGSPISPSDTNSIGSIYCMPAAPLPSTGSVSDITGTGIVASVLGALNWANAAGGTVDASLLSNMNALLVGTAGYLAAGNANPKYTMQANYP